MHSDDLWHDRDFVARQLDEHRDRLGCFEMGDDFAYTGFYAGRRREMQDAIAWIERRLNELDGIPST